MKKGDKLASSVHAVTSTILKVMSDEEIAEVNKRTSMRLKYAFEVIMDAERETQEQMRRREIAGDEMDRKVLWPRTIEELSNAVDGMKYLMEMLPDLRHILTRHIFERSIKDCPKEAGK